MDGRGIGKEGVTMISKLPWRTEKIVRTYDESYVIWDSSDGNCIIRGVRKDDAEYICQAVNSYDADKKRIQDLETVLSKAMTLLLKISSERKTNMKLVDTLSGELDLMLEKCDKIQNSLGNVKTNEQLLKEVEG